MSGAISSGTSIEGWEDGTDDELVAIGTFTELA
jgi:hypothetical protein